MTHNGKRECVTFTVQTTASHSIYLRSVLISSFYLGELFVSFSFSYHFNAHLFLRASYIRRSSRPLLLYHPGIICRGKNDETLQYSIIFRTLITSCILVPKMLLIAFPNHLRMSCCIYKYNFTQNNVLLYS
jgi:hypothetical protein